MENKEITKMNVPFKHNGRKLIIITGKAVYVTATPPGVLLIAMTARALTFTGADDGLRFFFHPDWSLLLKADVKYF